MVVLDLTNILDLLYALPDLITLTLGNSAYDLTNPASAISMATKLQALTLSKSNAVLHRLLFISPEVLSLDLKNCEDVADLTVVNIPLTKLQNLIVDNTNISVIKPLLLTSRELESIDLNQVTGTANLQSTNISLPKLLYLTLQESDITAADFKSILLASPELLELKLYYYESLSQFELSYIASRQLLKLVILTLDNITNLDNISLSCLINLCPNLSSLKLEQINLSKLDFSMLPPMLKLKKLKLSCNNDITEAQVIQLLKLCPALTTLELIQCQNIPELTPELSRLFAERKMNVDISFKAEEKKDNAPNVRLTLPRLMDFLKT